MVRKKAREPVQQRLAGINSTAGIPLVRGSRIKPAPGKTLKQQSLTAFFPSSGARSSKKPTNEPTPPPTSADTHRQTIRLKSVPKNGARNAERADKEADSSPPLKKRRRVSPDAEVEETQFAYESPPRSARSASLREKPTQNVQEDEEMPDSQPDAIQVPSSQTTEDTQLRHLIPPPTTPRRKLPREIPSSQTPRAYGYRSLYERSNQENNPTKGATIVPLASISPSVRRRIFVPVSPIQSAANSRVEIVLESPVKSYGKIRGQVVPESPAHSPAKGARQPEEDEEENSPVANLRRTVREVVPSSQWWENEESLPLSTQPSCEEKEDTKLAEEKLEEQSREPGANKEESLVLVGDNSMISTPESLEELSVKETQENDKDDSDSLSSNVQFNLEHSQSSRLTPSRRRNIQKMPTEMPKEETEHLKTPSQPLVRDSTLTGVGPILPELHSSELHSNDDMGLDDEDEGIDEPAAQASSQVNLTDRRVIADSEGEEEEDDEEEKSQVPESLLSGSNPLKASDMNFSKDDEDTQTTPKALAAPQQRSPLPASPDDERSQAKDGIPTQPPNDFEGTRSESDTEELARCISRSWAQDKEPAPINQENLRNSGDEHVVEDDSDTGDYDNFSFRPVRTQQHPGSLIWRVPSSPPMPSSPPLAPQSLRKEKDMVMEEGEEEMYSLSSVDEESLPPPLALQLSDEEDSIPSLPAHHSSTIPTALSDMSWDHAKGRPRLDMETQDYLDSSLHIGGEIEYLKSSELETLPPPPAGLEEEEEEEEEEDENYDSDATRSESE